MLTNDDAREAWIDVTLDCDWENPSETGEAPDLAPWLVGGAVALGAVGAGLAVGDLVSDVLVGVALL